MAVTTTNLGVITAYGDAVAAGYTGTKAEWQALMASYATVGQQAVDAKNAAVAAKDTAVAKATEATTAATTATTKASEASASAQSIAQSASQIQENTDDITQLKSELTALIKPDATAQFGYVSPTNGNIYGVAAEAYKHITINVTGGATLFYLCGSNESGAGMAFYKEDGTYAGVGYSGSASELEIVVPDNAVTAKLTYLTSRENLFHTYIMYKEQDLAERLNYTPYLRTDYSTEDSVTGYVNINTGAVVNDNRYKYITVAVIPKATIIYKCGSNESVAGLAFYDANGAFIPNSGISGKTTIQELSIPVRAKTAKITYNVNNGSSFVAYQFANNDLVREAISDALTLTEEKNEVVVDSSGSGDYTSILLALKSTAPKVPIRIKKGTYNLIDEYEDFYGDSFFTSYTGYAGQSDPFYRGLWLAKGREIHGEPGAVIQCQYTGNNSNVPEYFSAIANDSNVLLENVTILFSNIRYAIHDDFQPECGTIIWKNIVFDGTPEKAAPIGGGFGLNSLYIIEGCVFLNNTKDWDINYHGSNNVDVDNTNTLRVCNCKGARRFGVWSNGPSTAISTCYVSNSQFLEVVKYTTSSTTNINVDLIAWNNTTP